MLSKKIPSHDFALDMMRDFVKKGGVEYGISYILAMNNNPYIENPIRFGGFERTYDDISLHIRTNQPCYGEMRRYHKTHEDYSDPQPHDEYRPGDLFWKFPKGVVEGYAVRFDRYNGEFEYLERGTDVLRFLFSDKSPYRKGFGTEKDIEFVYRDDVIVGMIGTNTNVDPTVLVSLLNFISRVILSERVDDWNLYVEKGLTPLEATAALMFVSNNPLENLSFGNSYFLPIWPDVRRVMEGDPHDLTGKTWRDGGDYNRKRLQDIFKSETSCVVPAEVIIQKLGDKVEKGLWDSVKALCIEDFIVAFKEMLAEMLQPVEMPSLVEAPKSIPEPVGCKPHKKKAKKEAA